MLLLLRITGGLGLAMFLLREIGGLGSRDVALEIDGRTRELRCCSMPNTYLLGAPAQGKGGPL